MEPKISIITPVYDNSKEYTGLKWLDMLNICLNNQIEQDFEWIIIYDGRSKECEEQVKKYDKVKYFELENRQGNWGNYGRDFGVKQALGDYLIFIDQDNIIFEDYLYKLSSILDNDKKIGISFCPIFISWDCLPQVVFPTIERKYINTLMFMIRKSIISIHSWWPRFRGNGDEFFLIKHLFDNGVNCSCIGIYPLAIWNGSRYKYPKQIYPEFIEYSIIEKIAGSCDSDTRKDRDLWFSIE